MDVQLQRARAWIDTTTGYAGLPDTYATILRIAVNISIPCYQGTAPSPSLAIITMGAVTLSK